MDIERFMQGYKAAWEGRNEQHFCDLFAHDGVYCNTPFDQQRGHKQLALYWQRVKLQQDVSLTYEILQAGENAGIAHWHVTYQVASEELFNIWAQSTGTHRLARQPGDPLPRMALDGILAARFADGTCQHCAIWWHSVPLPSPAGREI